MNKKGAKNKKRIIPGFGVSLGITLTLLSIIVLIPMASLIISLSGITFKEFIQIVTTKEVLSAYKVSLFKGFEEIDNVDKVIIRSEFIKVSKLDEETHYIIASEEGIIENVSFRGNYIEIKVNVKGIILTTTRGTEDKAVYVGEKVRVLIYRLYVFHKDKSYIVENSSMNDKNPVFI